MTSRAYIRQKVLNGLEKDFKLSLDVADEYNLNEELLIRWIKLGLIEGRKVEGYWVVRVDDRLLREIARTYHRRGRRLTARMKALLESDEWIKKQKVRKKIGKELEEARAKKFSEPDVRRDDSEYFNYKWMFQGRGKIFRRTE